MPVQYIKGTFEESLTDALIEQLRPFPPALVTIDVDYYTSTLESLSWLDRFIASMYNGSAKELMMQLIGNKKASKKELDAIREMLDSIQKK